MGTLKYSTIESEEQYFQYCDMLETLMFQEIPGSDDEVDLLTLLIEKWDADHSTFKNI